MNSMFMLDTNICIYAMKRNQYVINNMMSRTPGQIHISVVTESELRFGAAKSASPERTLAALESFLAPIQIVDFTSSATRSYAVVRAALERAGRPIGPLDTMIAAHAISLSLTLVTNNVGEFEMVPDLTIENWATS